MTSGYILNVLRKSEKRRILVKRRDACERSKTHLENDRSKGALSSVVSPCLAASTSSDECTCCAALGPGRRERTNFRRRRRPQRGRSTECKGNSYANRNEAR